MFNKGVKYFTFILNTAKIMKDYLYDRGKKMKEKTQIFKSTKAKIILIVLILVVGFLVRGKLEETRQTRMEAEAEEDVMSKRADYAKSVGEDNKILKAFLEYMPGADVQVACEEDVTDDGCKDLVVIYKKDGLTRTVVAVDSGDGVNYEFTEPIPGPIENQKIQFKNIDKEGEIEFIITGEKNGAVGYAIYRMIDGAPTDLFGEGMEDCC